MKIGMSIGFGDIKMTGGLEKRIFSELVGVVGRVNRLKGVNRDNTF